MHKRTRILLALALVGAAARVLRPASAPPPTMRVTVPSAWPPPFVDERNQLDMSVWVTTSELRVCVAGVVQAFPRREGRLDDDGLRALLERVRREFSLQRYIYVSGADDVAYEDVVRAIDDCLGAGQIDVTVPTVDSLTMPGCVSSLSPTPRP